MWRQWQNSKHNQSITDLIDYCVDKDVDVLLWFSSYRGYTDTFYSMYTEPNLKWSSYWFLDTMSFFSLGTTDSYTNRERLLANLMHQHSCVVPCAWDEPVASGVKLVLV